MANNKYTIGKIPGYNDGILPSQDVLGEDGKKYYLNRLLNNLNIIDFTPVSYKIAITGELISFLDNMTNKDYESKLTTDFKNTVAGLNKMVDGITDLDMGNALDGLLKASKSFLTGITYSRRAATSQWTGLMNLSSITKKNPSENNLDRGFIIQGTNDSTVNETLSNEYGANFFQELAEGLGDKVKESTIGPVLAMGAKANRSYDSSAGLAMLNTTGSAGLLGMLTGMIQGVRINMPKVWKNSDYNSSMNIMVKLISPSGDTESIRKYIKEPLEILMRAGAPVTFDGVMAGYPMIWEVRAHGLAHFKLGAISALTITRGGNDTVFNKYDEPLNIDVRVMITPVNDGFAQGYMKDYSMTDPSDVIYSLSSLVDGNHDIIAGVNKQSYENASTADYTAINSIRSTTTRESIKAQKIYI